MNPISHFFRKPLCILAVLGVSTSLGLSAEALVVSLSSIPDRIKKQNPDLAAARYRIAEAYGRLNQAGRYTNPELELGITQNDGFRERSFSVGIAQKFPLTNRLALEKAVSISAVKKAQAEILDVERRLVTEAQLTMVKILTLQTRKDLLQKQSKVAAQFAKYMSEAAEVGEGSVLDAGQAKLEAASLTQQARQLNTQTASLTGALKPLLGMSVSEALIVSGRLPEIHTPARSTNPENRPDLQATKHAIKEAEEAATLERAKSRDDIEISLTGSVERTEDAPEGFETDRVIGIGIKIPLPLHNKNEGNIQEADARKERKKKESQALAHNIRHEAATAHQEMLEWAKTAREISHTLLPLAQKQADLANEAFRIGQGTLQANLRTRDQLLTLESSHLDALREFHLARIRYHSALAQ